MVREVIVALEGVINEVQNREDEIESLSDTLQRRDEELEHAKIIATKALQSAKDIQKRYRDKAKDQESVAFDRIDELNDSINELTAKNDTLQHKVSGLERDLKNKNLECNRLRDQLKQFDEMQVRDNGFTIEASGKGFEMGLGGKTYSTEPSSTASVDDDDTFEADGSFNPFDKQHASDKLSEAGTDDTSTIATSELVGDNIADNGSVTSNDTNNNKPQQQQHQQQQSRKSIERDALRRYVRERYRKRGALSN